MPKGVKMKQTNRSNSVDGVWQMWHQKGQFCPKGTVPTRRSTLQDVLRAKSLYNFGKKLSTPSPDITGSNGHEVCFEFSFYTSNILNDVKYKIFM